MQTRLRKIGNGYGVLLPRRLIESLRLSEGDVLTLTETDSGIELSPFDADFSEQVDSFRKTESRHRNSYRELAK
jgi:putative addiction module antidote